MAKIVDQFVSSSASRTVIKQQPLRVFFKNPMVQFVILGLAFALIHLLTINGVLASKYSSIAASVMIYTMICSGFCLLLGYAGLASLGSSCFVGIGAYCAYYCLHQWKVPYIVSILMALLISFLIGVSIGFISLRVQGLFLGIITMGLSEVIRLILRNIHSVELTMRNRELKLFGMRAEDFYFFVFVVIMVVILILINNLMHSPTGRNLLAMKNSASAAQAFGVNLLYYRVLAFVIACVVAAIAGTCYMTRGNTSITPTSSSDPALSLTLSLNILASVIIGGYKSLWGTFAGTVFVFGFTSLFAALLPDVYQTVAPYVSLIIGVLMIVIVMFYPGGFYQLFYTLKYRIKAAKAKRRAYLYGAE